MYVLHFYDYATVHAFPSIQNVIAPFLVCLENSYLLCEAQLNVISSH